MVTVRGQVAARDGKLRLVDTALGTAVGLGTAWIALRLTATGTGAA